MFLWYTWVSGESQIVHAAKPITAVLLPLTLCWMPAQEQTETCAKFWEQVPSSEISHTPVHRYYNAQDAFLLPAVLHHAGMCCSV